MTEQALEASPNDPSRESPRRRKASAEALAGREAATLVRGLNRQIGLWQGASIKLHTMAQRLASSGGADRAFMEQGLQLFHQVTSEARRFETIVSAKPAAVAQHSRVNDTRQSFAMVVDRLRLSFKLLGIEPPAE